MEIKQKKRGEIPAEFKWHIHNLCPDTKTWHSRTESLKENLENFKNYQGKLNDAKTLLDCLNKLQEITQTFAQLYVYATMKHHEDTGVAEYQALSDTANSLESQFSAAVSFVKPEILTLGSQKINEFRTEEKDLELYNHMLDDYMRQKDHVLNAQTEALLAEMSEIGDSPQNIFSMLTNADLKFGSITNAEGDKIEVTQGNFTSLLRCDCRRVRKDTFNTFYDTWWKVKNTLATAYNANVKKDIFFSRARKHQSALEAALFTDNIPVSVHDNLISTVGEFLPSLHAYTALRKKALKLDELHPYDLYVPFVDKVQSKMPYEEAKLKLLEGLTPLGEDYISALKTGLDGGWIDVYENEGKRSGAYSWGAYGAHPFVLMNYDNTLDDMFTLAHEMGHAMHSYYSWASQPFVYCDYTIFLAEVASTVNETLLMDYMLKTTSDEPKMQAYLINEYLEQFRGTVFRQTMFAEFEAKTHAMSEKGQPLTLEALNALYRTLNEKYYGPALTIDEKFDLEWARIPHFYRAFYVYKYATGYSSAVAITQKLIQEQEEGTGTKVRDAYLNFLKSGGSDYSINILKKAGVDMSTPAPIKDALSAFSNLITHLEKLL